MNMDRLDARRRMSYCLFKCVEPLKLIQAGLSLVNLATFSGGIVTFLIAWSLRKKKNANENSGFHIIRLLFEATTEIFEKLGSPSSRLRWSPPSKMLMTERNFQVILLRTMQCPVNGLSPVDNEAVVEPAESSFSVHRFGDTVSDTSIFFEVLRMRDSLLIWIGLHENNSFNDLSLAVNSLSSKVFGHREDSTSTNLANRLSRRLKKPVFVSYNVPASKIDLPGIERRMIEEITTNPSAF